MNPKPTKTSRSPHPKAALRPAGTCRPRKPCLLSALALIVLTLAAYANSFDSGFVMDSRGLIVSDPRVHDASSENIRLIFEHTYWWPNGEAGLYRPFTTLSWLFNYAIAGNREQPAGYHLINLLLHSANVLMAYALALRFLRRMWPAFFIAAVWAVHPVLTESVTNIAGRPDLLAAGAILGGLLVYLRSVEATGWRRAVWLATLTTVTAVGVFSKESAAVIPAAIVLYELTFRPVGQAGRRWGSAQIMGLLATLVPIAVMLYVRSRVFAGTPPYEVAFTDNPIGGVDFVTGRLTALRIVARYFALIAWPDKLSADYSWSEIPLATGSAGDWIVAIAVIALVPATIFLFWRFKEIYWARAGFFFFWLGMISLAPVSNLIYPVSMMAERYLYLVVLGVVACVVPAVLGLVGSARIARGAPVLLCILIAALTARTWMRNADWKDDLTIATASVQASPGSFKTHDMLANALFTSDPSHSNIDRVIEESEKSRAILDPVPDNRKPAHPYLFAATCYMARKDYPRAIAVLLKFVSVEAASPGRLNDLRRAYGYLALSSAYLSTGAIGNASDAAAHSLALDPLNPKIYLEMAEIAVASRRMDDAFVRLTEGEFMTGDTNLNQALVDLYRRALDPRSCVLVPGREGPEINSACDIVRAHVCSASPFVVGTLARSEQRDVAVTRKNMFIGQFGCPAGPLEGVLR